MSDTQEQSAELRELYRDLILDHAQNPRHFGKLSAPSHVAEGINPLCGDKLKIYFQVDEHDHIIDVKFEGSGCAISVASASLLTEIVIGRDVAFADQCFTAVVKLLTGDGDGEPSLDLGKIKALEGVKEYPSRVKCATLAWHAFHSAFNSSRKPATTE